jgi:hypothetical protein
VGGAVQVFAEEIIFPRAGFGVKVEKSPCVPCGDGEVGAGVGGEWVKVGEWCGRVKSPT